MGTNDQPGNQGQGSQSFSLAEAVIASIALRDLYGIRRLYPDALPVGDAREIHRLLVEHLSTGLSDSRFDAIRENLYSEPCFDEPLTEGKLSLIFGVLVAHCPNVQIVGESEKAIAESIDQGVKWCHDRCSLRLQGLLQQMFEIKIYDCRIPSSKDEPTFSDTRRSLQLLRSYWELSRSVILHQMDALVGFQPHPLLRLLVNLRSRIESYFDRLSNLEGVEQARESVGLLMDITMSGQPDDLSADPESTREQVQIVDNFLETTRLRSGSKTFPITSEEEVFLKQAEKSIEKYHKRVRTAGSRMIENASMRVDQHSGEDVDVAYCHVITREGKRAASKAQYERLVDARDEYDMFIDGMTQKASCRHDKQKPRAEKLTPKELGILSDFIQAGKPIRPYNTKTGKGCASISSACRLFVGARKKVDVKLGRYRYRSFRLHKNCGDSKLNAHEFTPPDGFLYCLIPPA